MFLEYIMNNDSDVALDSRSVNSDEEGDSEVIMVSVQAA